MAARRLWFASKVKTSGSFNGDDVCLSLKNSDSFDCKAARGSDEKAAVMGRTVE